MEQLAIVLTNTFQDLINRFIATQDVAISSRSTYRNALNRFFRWIQEQKQPAIAPNRETILAYKQYLDLQGLRPFTRSNYLVAVRRFFEWTESMKLYPNIAKGIKGAKRSLKAHHKDSLSVQQAQKLLGSINQTTLVGKRDFALINLLIRTGLRLIEILRADVGDITYDGDDPLLWIRGKGKDGKDDFVVVTKSVLEPLQLYFKTRGVKKLTEPLFASVSDRNFNKRLTVFSLSRLIKQHLRAAGFSSHRVTAHSLRHTFGVLSMKGGASLYEVQLAMRHSAPSTTELYLGDIERQKRLEASPERKVEELLNKL
jgi:integrase/recombinase XerC/integrase/recombinase XerD